MLWLWAVSLSSATLIYALSVPLKDWSSADAHQPDQPGVVRRYALPHLQGWEVQDVLRAAELTNGRVWDTGPSHVDVLFNHPDQVLELPLPAAGSIPLSHPEVLAGSSGKWNLGSLSNSTYHSVYHPLYEINEFMEEMARAYPNLVQLVDLGHTGEGREMIAMKLSKEVELSAHGDGTRSSSVKKAGFVVTGAQHAREWIAVSTAQYLAHALVADASEKFTLSSWLDYFDFYIIPVPNPDGYTYTWESDRFWYKNRQNVGPAEQCTGIDMNRNWGHKWKSKSHLPSYSNITDESGAKNRPDPDPCSTWYPGHRPFEAPEVNNIANFITTLPSLKAFVDLRSYGQMFSIPFSYSCKKTPKDAEDQLEAALGAAYAIKQVHGTVFTTGSLCEQLYKASGNVVDYMYAKAGIKYSYSVHLRDTGTYGFSLPAEWIRPVGEETANMIRSLAGFISKKMKV
ncbi:hypothetical protein L226DRAFT_530887 [Lentinus tigrinus ALCF2SS1-7]|uniref:Peptidase M14 domain-containing protein n=1 Tax=Lentinus tigrinus ALCF2SS1-6 TaxID=1328759 RepID=A0A5C2SPG9_9APHY|nr:hypothetical protein L227DRAFT_518520 [Lentinus tigrinus ALCF2SS1-6]RPD79049.1 hypothetical protein L226DRAFT_530887 [Lentinus tigrinus ALCF2SS1-7]